MRRQFGLTIILILAILLPLMASTPASALALVTLAQLLNLRIVRWGGGNPTMG